MTELQTLQWLNLALNSLGLVVVIRAGFLAGKVLQKLEDHGNRIERLEDRMDDK